MTDNIVIPSDWTFKNQSVAEGFDRHVREQLPWYDLATGAVAHIARHYLPENGRLYDIGTSTGNMCRALSETLKSRHIETYAIEPSEQMMSMWSGPRDIELLSDNAEDVTYQPYDVAICFLVLMFLTKDNRKRLLEKLRRQLRRGGAIIIVDKVDTNSGYFGTVLHRLTLAGKVATGVTADEIIAKELSLPGAQRPLSLDEVPADAMQFLRFGEFVGWVIEG